jgi:hypothetical protein
MVGKIIEIEMESIDSIELMHRLQARMRAKFEGLRGKKPIDRGGRRLEN